jgi:hypothetical protein
MTKVNKVMCILFIFLGMILFNSCPDPDPSYVNIYPSNIEIPNIGTLKYSNTLWDGKNKGIDIYDATKIDDEIWVFAGEMWGLKNGLYLYKGINKSTTNNISIKNIDGIVANDYWGYGRHEIVTKGDYILLFATRYEYEPVGKRKFYYMRINRNSRDIKYFDFSESIESYYSSFDLDLFHRNNDVFLVHDGYASNNAFFTVNNDCNEIIKTDEESFNNYINQNKNTVYKDDNGRYREFIAFTMDDNGRYYRIRSGFGFEISVDNGETWYTCDIGTNVPMSIIIQNNDVYVFCSAASKWVSSLGTKSVGGGIHVFSWK